MAKKKPKQPPRGRPVERLHTPPIPADHKRAIGKYLRELQAQVAKRLARLDVIGQTAPPDWVEAQRPYLRAAGAFLKECQNNLRKRRTRENV